MHFAGYPAAVDELRELCDEHGIALIEDVAHAPDAPRGRPASSARSASPARSASSPTRCSPCGEGGLLAHRRRRRRRARPLAALAGHDARHLEPPHRRRPTPTTSVGLGFNYRLDEPRAALLLSRLRAPGARTSSAAASSRARYRELLADVDGLIVPYTRRGRRALLLLRDAGHASRTRAAATTSARHLRERTASRRASSIPPIHEFTAYRERFGAPSLPRTELVARAEITLPLFPHMTDDDAGPRRRRARARRCA